MRKSIELDCPPGAPRPWELIGYVTEGTGIVLDESDLAPGAIFGYREWVFPTLTDEEWKAIQPTLKARIVGLHEQGVIRAGSW
jgi:hypothetical protein